VLPLSVPPLRERLEDLPLLVERLLTPKRAARSEGLLVPALHAHRWPGNVRELRSYVERALAMGPERALAMLQGTHAVTPASPPTPASGAGVPRISTEVPFKELREQWLHHLELQYLREMIRQHGRHAAVIADASGLDKSYVHRLLRKHEL
jgi:two-component system, NtrC family, response regulator GlrR